MVHSLVGRRQRWVEISNILYAGKGMAIVVMLFSIANLHFTVFKKRNI